MSVVWQGTGTELDPFLISSVEHLNDIRNKVSNEYYYKQSADLEMNGSGYDTSGWTPIDYFKGYYDGDNHKIRNLYLNKTGNGIGLFGRVQCNTTIKNLTLENVLCSNTMYHGASEVGGLIGLAYYPKLILENVKVSGDIRGKNKVGGIIGNLISENDDSKITGCVFDGIVRGKGSNIGGICGLKTNNILSVFGCLNKAKIASSGEDTCGGLFGCVTGTIYLNDSSNIGNVACLGHNVGGIIGGLYEANAIISRCCVNCDSIIGETNVGGICGCSNADWMSVDECLVVVNDIHTTQGLPLDGSSGQSTGTCEPIFPYSTGTINVTKTIYNSDMFVGTTNSGIGKTTSQMKNPQTYTDIGWIL